MATPLKDENRLSIWGLMLANFAIFYTVVQSDAILAGDWMSLVSNIEKAVPAGIGIQQPGLLELRRTRTRPGGRRRPCWSAAGIVHRARIRVATAWKVSVDRSHVAARSHFAIDATLCRGNRPTPQNSNPGPMRIIRLVVRAERR